MIKLKGESHMTFMERVLLRGGESIKKKEHRDMTNGTIEHGQKRKTQKLGYISGMVFVFRLFHSIFFFALSPLLRPQ